MVSLILLFITIMLGFTSVLLWERQDRRFLITAVLGFWTFVAWAITLL